MRFRRTPQTHLEVPFKRFLEEAGLPTPEAQKRVDLGPGIHTVPDFFYQGDDGELGICIYTDGLSESIHGNAAQAAKDKFLREKARSLGYEVVEVPSFDVGDDAALIAVVARIAKYLVGKGRARELREDTSWLERAKAKTPLRGAKVLRLVRLAGKTADAVPLVDLKAAAGAFSAGQAPAETGWARIEGLPPRSGVFLAQVVGDSMNQVVPSGSWCLWESFGNPDVSPPTAGDLLIVRRANEHDPELGEFTFKQLMEDAEGRFLAPRSSNQAYVKIRLRPTDAVNAVARFIAVVDAALVRAQIANETDIEKLE
jgi:SOS-response transcriptional repressor LexA